MDRMNFTTGDDKPWLFQGKGLGTKDQTKPISVKLPPHIDGIVRALPNRSEWLRQAIEEKLIRDGMLE